MQTISAAHQVIIGRAPRFFTRFSVKDAGGTWRDLTTWGGVNLVKRIAWRDRIDDPGQTWEVTLQREIDSLSVAPLMTGSAFNKGFSHSASYAPLIANNREIKIEWALQAEDDPSAKSWNLALSGYIDTPDSAKGVQIVGRGIQQPLVRKFIERERIYAYAQGVNATKGVYVWPTANVANRTFAVGELAVPSEAKLNGHFYAVDSITTGIVGANEPAWPTGSGATVVDGGVTWKEKGSTSTTATTAIETVMQQILDDNDLGTVSIWCPSSPGATVTWFQVDKQELFGQLRAMVDQTIGWCFRPMYDSGSGTFRMKLFDPNRSTTTSLHTFSASRQRSISKLAYDGSGIRNDCEVTFPDATDLDAGGNPKRKAVRYSDATSITANGREFCGVDERSASLVNDSTKATLLATNIVTDLKDPIVEAVAEVTLFPWAEVTDLYTLAANGSQFDTDQKLAVYGYEHSSEAGELVTTLELRGKPASGYSAWHASLAELPGFGTGGRGGEVHAITAITAGNAFAITLDPSTLTAIGGVKGFITREGGNRPRRVDYEIHLSTSSSFTPSSSTLKAKSNGQEFETGALIPGTTYYLQVVPIAFNDSQPIRGSPSVETSFVAGYAEPGHLNPETQTGPRPANGGFEGWTNNGSSAPPSHWTVQVGAWNREVSRSSAGEGRSGLYALNFTSDTTTVVKVRSAYMQAAEKIAHTLSVWVQPYGSIVAGDELQVAVEWYDGAKSLLATDGFVTDLDDLNGDEWTKLSRTFTPPDDTKFARVYLAKTGPDDYTARFDDVALEAPSDRWHTVGDAGEPPYEGTWAGFGGDDARFRLDGNHAELAGVVASGTIGNEITILPEALWPTVQHTFAVASNDAYGQVTIATDGRVLPDVGSATWISLAGVRWPLD